MEELNLYVMDLPLAVRAIVAYASGGYSVIVNRALPVELRPDIYSKETLALLDARRDPLAEVPAKAELLRCLEDARERGMPLEWALLPDNTQKTAPIPPTPEPALETASTDAQTPLVNMPFCTFVDSEGRVLVFDTQEELLQYAGAASFVSEMLAEARRRFKGAYHVPSDEEEWRTMRLPGEEGSYK